MKKETLLVLLALNAYRDSDNLIHIIMKDEDLYDMGYKECSIREYIKELIDLGELEDISKIGYAKRFKSKRILQCPDFIFNKNLSIPQKCLLIEIMNKNITNYSKSNLEKELKIDKLENIINPLKEEYNRSIEEIIKNVKPIKRSLSNKYFWSENGYQFKQINYNRECICQYCGETNPGSFRKSSTITCQTCVGKRNRKNRLKDIPKFLLSQANAGKKRGNKVIDITITVNDIKEQLDKQNNRCYYTNIEFNTTDLLPSIDRIDSNKGYIPNNIVICLQKVNVMKSDLSIEDFKNFISLIYKNINNI